jgi:mitochondrial chaperone BCS1
MGKYSWSAECDWDQLTLDFTIASLLKNDFETFFERKIWFRKRSLPFRRGYLLHGPPSNGKSTAIRAMLSSRGLTAYTMRFFDQRVNDEDLERLFRRATENTPSMVILEDVDRVFPGGGRARLKLACNSY